VDEIKNGVTPFDYRGYLWPDVGRRGSRKLQTVSTRFQQRASTQWFIAATKPNCGITVFSHFQILKLSEDISKFLSIYWNNTRLSHGLLIPDALLLRHLKWRFIKPEISDLIKGLKLNIHII